MWPHHRSNMEAKVSFQKKTKKGHVFSSENRYRPFVLWRKKVWDGGRSSGKYNKRKRLRKWQGYLGNWMSAQSEKRRVLTAFFSKVLLSPFIFFLFAAKNLFESCTYNQQCSNRNEQAICQQYEQRTRCSCRKGFREEKAHEIPIRYECVLGTYSKMSFSQNFWT